jgi:hypothetical protein
VRHRQDQKYASQDQEAYDQQMAEQQAAAPPPPAAAPPEDDKFAKLEKLADLNKQGILTDEEFAAEKAKILSS